MNPIGTVSDAITLPIKAVGVVGLCFVINWMTSPGYWWVKWVALGMGYRGDRRVVACISIGGLDSPHRGIGYMGIQALGVTRVAPACSNGWGRSHPRRRKHKWLTPEARRSSAPPARPWVVRGRRGNEAT
jgi:hypothetical protein